MLDIFINERLSEEFVIGKKGYMQRHIENLSLVILKVFLIITIYNGIAKADDKKVESHIIEFTQGQVAIIGNLLGAKGNLTSEMHERFWSDVSKYAISNAGGLSVYEYKLESDLIRRVDLLHEMWRSAKLSWIAGEDIETSEFQKAIKNHQEHANNSNRLAKLGMRQDISVMMEVILIAASSGAMSQAGKEPIITLDEINLSINARNNGIKRAKALASSTWAEAGQ